MSQRVCFGGSYRYFEEWKANRNMVHRVCPVWIGYLLLVPFRKLWQSLEKILSDHVHQGMTVLDVGSAMGYFSIPMARIVGAQGEVISVDMQEGMLSVLRRRAAKAGLGDRVKTHPCAQDSLRLEEFAERIDFALAFAVVHEVPDSGNLFQEIAAALKPHARLLVAEPKGHVSDKHFAGTVSVARQHGFQVAGEPRISRSHAVLLQKQ